MSRSTREAVARRRAAGLRQMLLVRAATLGDERAGEAWERWSDGASPESVHSGEIRLLAAAYRRLGELGVGGPMVEVAKGVYRRTWYANQLAVARNAEIIGRLNDAGIRSLVLKGFGLAVLHYRDLGARPMEDLDLLVDPERIEEAARVLEPLGFRPEGRDSRPTGLLATEIELADAKRNAVEMHGYSLIESADDSDLWERRQPFALRDVEAFAPAPADSLLNVCAHGMRWNAVQPVSWAVDAVAIVRSADGFFDWERFADRAIARELTLPTRRAVGVLRSLEVDVPDRIDRRLAAAPPSLERRLADRAGRAVPTRRSTLLLAWDRYRRFRALAPPERRASSFPSWLAETWRVASASGLVIESGRRALSLQRSLRGDGR